MDTEKICNVSLPSAIAQEIYNNDKRPEYLSSFITVTSILSTILFCFVLGNFLNSRKPNGLTMKSVSMLSIIKHFVQCKFDLMHTTRSLLNTYGPVWKVDLFGLCQFVFLHDPAMLQKLYMSTDQGHLNKPNFLYERVLVGPAAIGLTSFRAKTWKPHRKALSKGFTYNNLKNHVELFNEYGKNLINRLNEEPCYSKLNMSTDCSAGNLSRIIYETDFDILSHITVGKANTLSKDEINLFYDSFYKCKKLLSYRVYHPWLIPDTVWWIHPKGRELSKILKTMEVILDKICKGAEVESIKNKDTNRTGGLVSLAEEMKKSQLSDKEIRLESHFFIVSGHETSSMTLILAIFNLAANAKFQKNCQQEVDRLFSEMMAKNQQEISMEAISSLDYLDRFIKELLRLYPTTPVIGRELESPIALDENITLKAGTTTLTSLWLLHRNKDHFSDPEKFDPDRFLPENSAGRKLCEIMSYAVGPRNCIGGKSGTLAVKILLAYILYNFELSTDATVEDLQNAFEKCIWPTPDLPVRLTRRR